MRYTYFVLLALCAFAVYALPTDVVPEEDFETPRPPVQALLETEDNTPCRLTKATKDKIEKITEFKNYNGDVNDVFKKKLTDVFEQWCTQKFEHQCGTQSFMSDTDSENKCDGFLKSKLKTLPVPYTGGCKALVRNAVPTTAITSKTQLCELVPVPVPVPVPSTCGVKTSFQNHIHNMNRLSDKSDVELSAQHRGIAKQKLIEAYDFACTQWTKQSDCEDIRQSPRNDADSERRCGKRLNVAGGLWHKCGVMFDTWIKYRTGGMSSENYSGLTKEETPCEWKIHVATTAPTAAPTAAPTPPPTQQGADPGWCSGIPCKYCNQIRTHCPQLCSSC